MATSGHIQEASLTSHTLPLGWIHATNALFALSLIVLVVFLALKQHKTVWLLYENFINFCTFFYSSFMKPHSQNEGSGQQAALESFYKVQVAHLKSPPAA